MKINLLTSNVYNKIAAGEVVEKPFNVVKELVENSIDAGANKIKIEIQNGGIDLIRITDNGSGIEKDQIQNAFASHATSKILNIEDLEKISTLGFRGEALASIASVSKINLKTKTDQNDFGTETENIAGSIVSQNEVGLFTGSIFEIKDLFFNVPARKKFLKKSNLEEGDITDFVERLILSHPEISFEYVVNDKKIYNFISSDLENAIFTIYGKETYQNLIKVNAINDKNNEIKLTGFVGKPTIAKSNKKYQSLFINGRYVKNQTIYSAVGRVFENYLMKGKYPFYVLNLTIPSNLLDVNVHPTKQEVRFVDNAEMFSFVYKAINLALLNANKINTEDALSNKDVFFEIPKTTKGFNENISLNKNENMFNLFSKKDSLIVAAPKDIELSFNPANIVKNETIETKVEINQTKPIFNDYKFIGTLFKTYIVIEEGENVYFIDQHAAHERLLFDKLCDGFNNEEQPKQQLLVPYIITLQPNENEVMQLNLEALNSLGFAFEEFGKSTYKLNEVPLILKEINIDNFLNDMFENKKDLINNIKTTDVVRNKIATFACKSAVKAGSTLSESEIDWLIKEIKKNDMVLLCPHGRPVVVVYSKKDFEKWFKRIV